MKHVFQSAVHVVAALAAAASPVYAQQVGRSERTATAITLRPLDSLTVLGRRLSEAGIRQLNDEIVSLITLNKQRHERFMQMLGDTTRTRQAMMLQEELARVAFELASKESELRLACLVARPAEEIPGTLGIDLDTQAGVRWMREVDDGRETLTMIFGASPPKVKSIVAGSPAEKAGMQPGDVWTSINGRPLVGMVRFDELLAPGTTVTLRALRGGRDVELPAVTVALRAHEAPAYPVDVCESARVREGSASPVIERFVTRMPTPPRPAVSVGRAPMPRTAPSPPGSGTMQLFAITSPSLVVYAGATLSAVDEQWRSKMGVKHNGIIVVDIAPSTPAEIAGLARFDVITSVNGTPVADPVVFRRLAAENRVLQLTITNTDGTTRTVKLAR